MRLLSGAVLAALWGQAAIAAAPSGRGLDITTDVALSYDDNVFRAPDGVTRAGGHRSDMILEPRIGVLLQAPLGPVGVSLDGSLGYRFHRHNKGLDRETMRVGVGANSRLARCDVALNGGYSRGQSDLGDLVGSGGFVNVEDRIIYGANVLCGNQFGIRPGFGYSHVSAKNSARSRKISDYDADTYTASIGYSRPALGMLSLYGSYRDGSYPNRPALGPGLEANDRIRVYSGGMTFSRDIGSRLTGVVSVGYMKVDPRAKSVPNFHGMTYSGALSFRGSNRLSGTINFAREAEQSNLLISTYGVTTQYHVSAKYALTPSISLNAGGGYSRRKFKQSSALPVLFTGSDSTKQVSAGVSFATVRRLSFDLSASHIERSGHSGLTNYSANRLTLTTGLRF